MSHDTIVGQRSHFLICVGRMFVVYQEKNFPLVEETLESIPPTHEMVAKSQYELKNMLDRHSPLAYPLLQWQVIKAGRR